VGGPESLIAALGSRDLARRRRARMALQSLGQPAVRGLIDALSSPAAHVRWEAAKALVAIHDPAAAPSFVKLLDEDEDEGVRWVAAEGLIELDRAGLEALLRALIWRSHSPGSATVPIMSFPRWPARKAVAG